jgi:hypothetical protein
VSFLRSYKAVFSLINIPFLDICSHRSKMDVLMEEPTAPTKLVDKPVGSLEIVKPLSAHLPGLDPNASGPAIDLELSKIVSAHHDENSSKEHEKSHTATHEVNGQAPPGAYDNAVGNTQAQEANLPPLPLLPDGDELQSQTEVTALKGQLTALLARLEKVEANPM